MSIQYLWGFGLLAIGDGDTTIIEFENAITNVWFEREEISNQTLDGTIHTEQVRYRGYIESTIFNTSDGDGEKLSQLMSMLANTATLRIYPQYSATQNNLLMDCRLISNVAPKHLAQCQTGQQLTLQFREVAWRLSIPTVLHYPAGESYGILTGEDGTSVLKTGEDADDILLWRQ